MPLLTTCLTIFNMVGRNTDAVARRATSPSLSLRAFDQTTYLIKSLVFQKFIGMSENPGIVEFVQTFCVK